MASAVTLAGLPQMMLLPVASWLMCGGVSVMSDRADRETEESHRRSPHLVRFPGES
ncbi:hypothetical protein PYCC9005_003912 [Savitreella phatthalungensis]